MVKKRILIILVTICCWLLALGCKNDNINEINKLENSGINTLTDAELLDKQVDVILERMSIEEKIGQMMLVGISGTELDDDDIQLLKKYKVGGIILFDRNMEDPKQVTSLISEAQEKNDGYLPLFVAVDEEGGLVSRMEDKLTPPPSAEKIGETKDPKEAEKYAVAISKELKAMGFNVNFAPVADLGSPYERSYSDDPEIVTKFVMSAVKGYSKENMICSLKHFPGIGRGLVDSHVDGSNIDISLEELKKDDLIPFSTLIRHSPNDDYMVMVSHLSYPQIDEKYPASVSKKIINDLLRKDLGFKGIVITDDLEMGAVSKHYKFGEMGVKSINAGVDILLVCHEYNHIVSVYNGIYEAYKNGTITTERINRSVSLIIKNKLKHGLKGKEPKRNEKEFSIKAKVKEVYKIITNSKI